VAENLLDMTTPRVLRPVLTVLAVLSLVLPVSAAHAADGTEADSLDVGNRSASQCLTGRFCVWSGTGYTGAFWSTAASGVSAPSVATARTVWNRMGVAVQTFSGAGATGAATCWGAGALATSTSVASASVRTMGSTTC
jgi:hypothetical protein